MRAPAATTTKSASTRDSPIDNVAPTTEFDPAEDREHAAHEQNGGQGHGEAEPRGGESVAVVGQRKERGHHHRGQDPHGWTGVVEPGSIDDREKQQNSNR